MDKEKFLETRCVELWEENESLKFHLSLKQVKAKESAQKELLEELIRETETIIVNGKPISSGLVELSYLRKHLEKKLGSLSNNFKV